MHSDEMALPFGGGVRDTLDGEHWMDFVGRALAALPALKRRTLAAGLHPLHAV